MYYTGLGKALMASMTDNEVKEIWKNSEIKQYTPTTITTLPKMLEELEQIRKRGYAIDNEEHEAGIVCIADVIRDVDNHAVAALSISTIATRMDEDFLRLNVPRLHKTANKISAILGYASPESSVVSDGEG